jgi:hypothetical protein
LPDPDGQPLAPTTQIAIARIGDHISCKARSGRKWHTAH